MRTLKPAVAPRGPLRPWSQRERREGQSKIHVDSNCPRSLRSTPANGPDEQTIAMAAIS